MFAHRKSNQYNVSLKRHRPSSHPDSALLAGTRPLLIAVLLHTGSGLVQRLQFRGDSSLLTSVFRDTNVKSFSQTSMLKALTASMVLFFGSQVAAVFTYIP